LIISCRYYDKYIGINILRIYLNMAEGFNSEELKEFTKDFLVESRELIENVDQELVALEQNPSDPGLLNSIFRAVHTIKGTSSFIGLTDIFEFTHEVESILNRLRNAEIRINADIMDIILESIDLIKKLMEKIEDSSKPAVNTENTIKRIGEILRKYPDTSPSKTVAGLKNSPGEKTVKKYNSRKIKKRGVSLSGRFTDNNETGVQFSGHQESIGLPATGKYIETAAGTTGDAVLQINVERTMRIEVGRLDSLMDTASELVLLRNRLVQIGKYFEENYENEPMVKNLTESYSSLDLLTSGIHTSLMKLRMIPINKVFSKYPRMVRDLSRSSKKDISLVISGAETELDKSVCEELNDPLIHLIRNAIDHGIEPPTERKKIGKAAGGTINLKAYHESTSIVIEINDDGRGLDIQKIKEKAIKNKIITRHEADNMSDKETMSLIFKPGFSTAERVTGISGRGVGMDVVKTNIERLKGVVEIESENGSGTLIRLKLPLTLETMHALMIDSYGRIFAIPLTSVLEILSLNEKEIKTIRGIEVINLRDSVLPVSRLDKIFSIPENDKNRIAGRVYVVVLGIAGKRQGIIVSNLIGKEEIVIKPITGFIKNIQNISGATIMGDGRVAPVIDVPGLFKQIIE
ncbi:MAG: chemotaxis protein CheA, partial [Actinobacteria bacterium]|nr:chemotaxis protein CheA [Actinomycetota bacterium]